MRVLRFDLLGRPCRKVPLEMPPTPVDPSSNSLYHSLMATNANFWSSFLQRLALTAITFLFAYPLTLRAQTADDVINAYLKARGGLAKIKAVQTERASATITFAPAFKAPSSAQP